METGSNKSLFTLIAVVIFGVFLSLSYWLFQDEMKDVLASVMDGVSLSVDDKLDLMEDIIQYGYFTINMSGDFNLLQNDLDSLTFTSSGKYYWGDGIGFDARYLESNKTYSLSYDITKLEGSIVKIGGHNRLGNLEMKIDGVNYTIGDAAIVYPNDNLTHHIEIIFDTNNLVNDAENFYLTDNTETNYYIQPNRTVSGNLYYKVKLDNISIKEIK